MKTHHHLIAWQRSREVTLRVVQLRKARWSPGVDAVFRQLLRASLSVQLNIAEGWALAVPGSRRRHWRIAYGSSIETDDLLDLLGTLDERSADMVASTRATNRDVSRILAFWLRRKAG